MYNQTLKELFYCYSDFELNLHFLIIPVITSIGYYLTMSCIAIE